MPIYLDRHELAGMTPTMMAEAHRRDLEIQDDYGVKFITYWYDPDRETGFCLINAPDEKTAMQVHERAHGNVGIDIIPVDLSAVEAFLGRIEDPRGHPGPSEPVLEPAFRTIMFTDLVNSTDMTQRLGDARSVEMVRAHDAIVRRSVRDEAGREVKHTGDGIMAAFDEVANAVRCAKAIQVGFGTFNLASSEPLHVRIGMDAGEPVADSNDLFGHTVQKAARICDKAGSGEILVSGAIHDLTRDNFDFLFRADETLKGFARPEPVYAVNWQ